MKNISIFLYVFALCMIINNVYVSANAFKGKKTSLLFRNSLGHKNWLKVNCRSGNDNMGDHYLRPGGVDYGFDFHDNVVGNTLFWCTLSKGPDYKVSKKFDAYVQDTTKPHGGSYNYVAKDDGIYHSNFVDPSLKKVHNWN
ncbi:unnamed protein product [Cochlearia groenlandica]